MDRLAVWFRRVAPFWVVLGGIAGAGSAEAVTVVLRTDSRPIYGYLVEETPTRVVVRVELPDGSSEERVLPREQIQLLYNPVDVRRLEALDPAQPQEYRDFAEELAEKSLDPEARQLSLRLYCLAAHLDPERFGRSAALAMAKLATTESERRRYRIAAYLLDGGRDRSLLEGVKVPAVRAGAVDTARQAAYRVLEALRQGRYREALQKVRRPEVAGVLDRVGGPIQADDIRRRCEGRGDTGPPPPDDVAYQILLTERKLLAGSLDSSPPTSWAALSESDLRDVALPLTLEKLLPFDPHAVVFRHGRWQRP